MYDKLSSKAIFGSIFSVFLLCSVVTGMPLLEEPTAPIILKTNEDTGIIDDASNQLNEIFNFLENNLGSAKYNFVLNLFSLLEQRYIEGKGLSSEDFDIEAFISEIESLDEDIQIIIFDLIDLLHWIIFYLDVGGGNTIQYLLYKTLYLFNQLYFLGQNASVWFKAEVPLVVIIFFLFLLGVRLLHLQGILNIEQFYIFSSVLVLTPILYILFGFYQGWLLSIFGVDMSFFIVNETSVPLNGLSITADPRSLNVGFFQYEPFKAEQLPGLDGWYFIPSQHVADLDVPPGIFDFNITGIVDDKLYSYTFNNSENPLDFAERYAQNIMLTPEKY